jgi:DNA-binding MarR family transcriptional regulator
MSSAVNNLETAGLVVRSVDVAGDRRGVGIVVTTLGARLLRAARSSRSAWLAGRFHRLTPERVKALEAAIEALAAPIEDAALR